MTEKSKRSFLCGIFTCANRKVIEAKEIKTKKTSRRHVKKPSEDYAARSQRKLSNYTCILPIINEETIYLNTEDSECMSPTVYSRL